MISRYMESDGVAKSSRDVRCGVLALFACAKFSVPGQLCGLCTSKHPTEPHIDDGSLQRSGFRAVPLEYSTTFR